VWVFRAAAELGERVGCERGFGDGSQYPDSCLAVFVFGVESLAISLAESQILVVQPAGESAS
jgi:hypothetical protein